MIGWLCNRADAKKKQVYLNKWLKERLSWSRNTLQKEPSPATIER